MIFKGMKTNQMSKIICLCIVFLAIGGCSKSGKKVIIDKSDPNLTIINENLTDYMFLREDMEII